MDQFDSSTGPLPKQAPEKEKSNSPKRMRKRKISAVEKDEQPSAVNQQSTNPQQHNFDNLNNEKQSQCSRASDFLSQDSGHIPLSTSQNEQYLLTMPPEERQKLARAKRNREAAYRSRAKNKIRQNAVEEDTKKNLALNTQLRNMLEFLLHRLRSSTTAEDVARQSKRRKYS